MDSVRWVACVGACACAVFASGCGGGGTAASSIRGSGSGDGGSAASAAPDPQGHVTREDDASAPAPGVAYAVVFTMGSFTVPPGSEEWKCQDFANPFGGQQVDIKAWSSAMNTGSHHLTFFNQPGVSDGPLVDCVNGPPVQNSYAFGSQSEKLTYSYPDGVGEGIPAGMGFTMNSHYVNTTSATIQSSVEVTAFVAAPGSITQHAGGFDALLYSISVPPTTQTVTVGSSCSLPQDMNVIGVAGHMHKRASHFIATTGGTTLFETTEWDGSQPKSFSPPMLLKAGADLTWSCDYTNETNAALVYGPSALTNVMCNTVVAFYPIQDINNPLVTCVR